jgi:uncharacterized membrane protein
LLIREYGEHNRRWRRGRWQWYWKEERVESKAKIMGHPIHPILIPFPLGLLTTSVIFDVVHLLTGNGKWSEISFWMMAAGIIGGLVAAVFGLIDWLAIPSGTRAKAVGMWHGRTNVVMMTLFIVSWLLRVDVRVIRESSPSSFPLWPWGWPRWEVSSAGSWSSGWAWGWPKGRTSTRQARSPVDRSAGIRLARSERNRKRHQWFTKGSAR